MSSRFIPVRWGRKGRLLGHAGTALSIFAAGLLVLAMLWARSQL